jgi:hypothetical protein
MSQDFRKVLVKDDRLCVTDAVSYAVIKGGANVTMAQYNAIGSGGQTGFKTNINFNVQVPSQETVVARQALIQATLAFSITGNPVSVGVNTPTNQGYGYVFNYGGVDGFGPFPFHQLVNSVQWTINNNTISQNTRDILSAICRIHDRRFLQRYNGMTPVLPDVYGSYAGLTTDSVLNNPFGGFTRMGLDSDIAPRGYLPCVITGTNYLAVNAGSRTITVSLDVTEPILLSPFVFAGDDSQGIYGIQNFNAVYNLSSSTTSCVRFGGRVATRFTAGTLPVVTLTGVQSPRLLLQFLTPHPSDLLPSRNVVPYYEMPRYISTLPPFATPASATNGTNRVSSSSLQLNQVPDKLYIFARRAMDSRLASDPDAFLTIQNISINWNNSSGLLSSATQQDLWRMSTENGINQTWAEFIGSAVLPVTSDATGLANVITSGSLLCLEFGKDIELKDDYYAPGSLGNFQLQFTISLANNLGIDILANNFELVTIVQNSGVFSLERGVSSSYLGILTKSDVLEASREKPIPYYDAIRMVGGSKVGDFFKRLGSKLGTVGKYALPHIKDVAVDVISKKLGAGVGAGSGGRKRDMGALEDRMY